ncbi:MAG: hypothetical protein JWR72_3014 [Flavisolibacter sp.]|nr:hypothetical protein [Flavisolibacter sp.]
MKYKDLHFIGRLCYQCGVVYWVALENDRLIQNHADQNCGVCCLSVLLCNVFLNRFIISTFYMQQLFRYNSYKLADLAVLSFESSFKKAALRFFIASPFCRGMARSLKSRKRYLRIPIRLYLLKFSTSAGFIA